MRTVCVAIGIAGLLLGLLWAGTGWAGREDAHAGVHAQSGPVTVSQAGALVMTPTLGLDPARCGITHTLQVRAGTRVYPCYRIHHTAAVTDAATDTGAVTYTLHRISTARQGVITGALPLELSPGVITDTVGLGLAISDVAGVDVTDRITWEARTLNPAQYVTLTGVTVIDVVTPAVSLRKTAGQDSTICPSTQSLRVPAGSDVSYCLTVENRGNVTLTRHRLVDTPLGLDVTLFYTLPPGDRWQVTQSVLDARDVNATLGRSNVTALLTNTASVLAATTGQLTTTAEATAVVNSGAATVLFTKTVGTDPVECSTTTSLNLPPGSELYYCVAVRNNGKVTLTRHSLYETELDIDLAFDHPLPPGEELTVTNEVLVSQFGLPALFGPFRFNNAYPEVVNNTMFYTGTNAEGDRVNINAATFARFPPTPTSTPTPRPTETNTPVRPPTATPLPTNTPLPPTFTPSPTPTPVTPTPTPTRSYLISELATPTPRTPPAAGGAGEAGGDASPNSPLATPADAGVAGEGTAGDGQAQPLPQEPTPTATPAAGSQEQGNAPTPAPTVTPSPQPSQAVVVVVVTNTPAPAPADGAETGEESAMDGPSAGATPDPNRPIVYPTPTPTPDYLLLAARSLDAALVATTWLWVLGGALLFFISAGAVVGLFFWRRPPQRYALQPELDPDYDFPPLSEPDPEAGRRGAASSPYGPPPATGRTSGRAAADQRDEEDDWPADLP